MKKRRNSWMKKVAVSLAACSMLVPDMAGAVEIEIENIEEVVDQTTDKTGGGAPQGPEAGIVESRPAESEVEESETEPKETETEKPETEPAESETKEPETELKETETEKPETEPAESETEPKETETEEPETESAESETEEPETEPAESETEESETELAESETEEPETELAESETEEPETEPAESETEEPETELAESETEEPGEKTLADELGELLEKAFRESRGMSALEEYLGAEKLGDAVGENGLTMELQLGIGQESARSAGIPKSVAQDSYCALSLEIDPNQRQWQFDAGLVLLGEEFVECQLYGDSDMIALSSPQLYDEAIGIRSGNLYEQLEGSWVEEIAGEIPDDYRELEMDFFPDEEGMEHWPGKYLDYGSMQEQGREMWASFVENLVITKEKEGSGDCYVAEVKGDALEELLLGWEELSEDFYTGSLFEPLGETVDFGTEDVTVFFFVDEGRLERIVCEVPMDVSKWAEPEEGEAVSGSDEGKTVDEGEKKISGKESQVSEGGESLEKETDGEMFLEDGPEEGTMELEITFWEETGGISGAEADLSIEDSEEHVLNEVVVTQIHSVKGTKVADSLDLTLLERNEKSGTFSDLDATYYCQLFSSVFDTDTGEYETMRSLTDNRTGNVTYCEIKGKFEDVVPGEGFNYRIDQISFGDGEISLGGSTFEKETADLGELKGRLSIQAQPPKIQKPEEVSMLFEMTLEDATSVADTVMERLDTLIGAPLQEDESESET